MTLTELAEAYLHQRLTVIHEFYGDFQAQYRRLHVQINNEINPLLIQHGAKPVDPKLVPDLDDNV